MASPDSPCGIKEVDIAINYAVEEKDDTYQDLLTRLSAKQKALLIALARSGKNVQPTSGDFIKKYLDTKDDFEKKDKINRDLFGRASRLLYFF